MNVLFLTVSKIDEIETRGIYTDLLRELASQGNNIYIATPAERRFGEKTHLIKEGNVEILKIKTLNIKKTNVIEKGIGTLLLESQFLGAINKYWKNISFDLIVYTTPPITFNKVIETLKNRHKAKTYLLLKDIFPQNAVDLGMFKKNGFLYNIFRKKESKLYIISDKIGCMSPANKEYIIKHNPSVNNERIEIFPNSMVPIPLSPITEEERRETLIKFGIDPHKVISLYGGNLGKPQGIDFLIDVIRDNEKRNNHHILIIGDGTEFSKLNHWFNENKPKNATLRSSLPKSDYDKLVRIADIGLIFLDHRFTIPNYPSRLLSYIENAIPVLIASDPNTDIGKIAEKEGFGLWCESNSVQSFNEKVDKLINEKNLLNSMGNKGRNYFINELDVRSHISKLYDILV